jgi:hypothetical protein
MDPSNFPRRSLNIFLPQDESVSLPPKTWPLTVKMRERTIVADDVWPQLATAQPETMLIRHSVRKSKSKSRRFSVREVKDARSIDYFSIEPVKSKESASKEPILVKSASRSNSLSPPKERKLRTSPKVSVETVEEDKPAELVGSEVKVERTAKKSLEHHVASMKVRRTLSHNFLTGPRIQRTKSANEIVQGTQAHALKEVHETKFRVTHLSPHEIFTTVTRGTHWKDPVQPAFDEIVIHRMTDRGNGCVTTISPRKNREEKIIETTLHYYVRLVQEIYTQQGRFKVKAPEIKEQIKRLRKYEVIGGDPDSLKKMEEDLKDIPCFDILRRLSTRGFAPATYAAKVLWPKLFLSPQAIVDIETRAKMTAKKKKYLHGHQISSAADIILKRKEKRGGYVVHVIQRKLYEFNARLLTRVKVPKADRKVGKYDLIVTEVPIGSLVLSLTTKHRESGHPYHTFSVRMEDVTPLDINDLKIFNKEEDGYSHTERSKAEKIQKKWIQETRKFHHDKELMKHGFVIENGLVLYPGNKRPVDHS